MNKKSLGILVIVGVFVLIGAIIFSLDVVSAADKDKEIVYESSEDITDDLTGRTQFFSNMTVITHISNHGSNSNEIKIEYQIQGTSVGNKIVNLEPGETKTYEKSMRKYSDPNSDIQDIRVRIEDYPFGYKYENLVGLSNFDDVLLPRIEKVNIRHDSGDAFLEIKIAQHSPHFLRQAVYVHTSHNESGDILTERVANDTQTNQTPVTVATIEIEEDSDALLNGTIWHYQGFIDDNTVLTKVEFTETEQGELDVEYVEPSPISLETDNVHKTPTDLEQAQDDALSTADRWLVNDRAPAALVAVVLLVSSYVALRRRNVL